MMKICVLQPDYSSSAVDYQHYDPLRNLTSLIPDAVIDNVLINKLTTYRQIKELRKKNYDVFVNLCEGYLEWDVPSIDVIYALESLNLPFTGPSSRLYDPPKELMKYVAYCEGVQTPDFITVRSLAEIENHSLRYPLFVKPAKAGDSLGIDANSLVHDFNALQNKITATLPGYDELLVEEYVDGREFTVLVVANTDGKTCLALKPVEFIFPGNDRFKTYALKTSELHPEANVGVNDSILDKNLRHAAQKIFTAFNGIGYARLDFRMNAAGALFFLEINFTCSVFYGDGYEGSADYILKYDGLGQAGFLNQIILEGIERHRRKQLNYRVRRDAISGYGLYATADLAADAMIFRGEEKSQRLVTKRYVNENWSLAEKLVFRQYAYPLSQEVFLLWDLDPAGWAPQNHSCDPNTFYKGLNVYTIRPVIAGEELTLDYASFLDDNMEPFECKCGSPRCRGNIVGKKSNSVTARETPGK